MKLKIKALIVFFLTFFAATYISGTAMAYFHVQATDITTTLAVSFVTSLIMYLIWMNWTRKIGEGKASAR